jgi:hypothetical protein
MSLRVSVKRFTGLFFAILVFESCSTEPEFNFNPEAKRQFALLPGKIGVTIETPPDVTHYVIEKGDLRKVGPLPKAAYETNVHGIGFAQGATFLPLQKGYEYRGPYAVSPDKKFIAASISSGPSQNPTAFAIVNNQTKATVAIVQGDRARFIIGLTWSPDSQWIAALTQSSRLGWTPTDILGRLLGHPSPYMTFYLAVANISGTVVAQSKLIWEVPTSWAEIVWLE